MQCTLAFGTPPRLHCQVPVSGTPYARCRLAWAAPETKALSFICETSMTPPMPRQSTWTRSPEDVQITRQLVAAGNMIDIDVLDHLIIGRQRFVSLRERGMGFDK